MTAIVIQQPNDGDVTYPLVTVWAERIDALIQVGNTEGIVIIGKLALRVTWTEYGRLFGILNDIGDDAE